MKRKEKGEGRTQTSHEGNFGSVEIGVGTTAASSSSLPMPALSKGGVGTVTAVRPRTTRRRRPSSQTNSDRDGRGRRRRRWRLPRSDDWRRRRKGSPVPPGAASNERIVEGRYCGRPGVNYGLERAPHAEHDPLCGPRNSCVSCRCRSTFCRRWRLNVVV